MKAAQSQEYQLTHEAVRGKGWQRAQHTVGKGPVK
jgi:hypothetical protein